MSAPSSASSGTAASALSLAELLTVVAGFADLETAQRLLADNGGIAGLAQKSLTELTQIKGIGESKAAQVKAAFELGRRLLVAAPHERPVIKSPADAANLLMLEMATLEQEHLRTLIMDTKNHVLKIHTRLRRLAQHRRGARGRVVQGGDSDERGGNYVCHNHPRAIRRHPQRMYTSRARLWKRASCSASTCSTIW